MSLKSAQPKASAPKALDRLRQLRGKLEVENPAFRAASYLERRIDAFCDRVRDDLKARRKSLRWDQARLAEALDYSQSAISKLENGHAELTLRSLYRMAEAMGLHPVIAFVPSAETPARGEAEEITPEHERMLEAARAVEEAQAAMIRKMALMTADLVTAAKVEAQGEEAAPLRTVEAG